MSSPTSPIFWTSTELIYEILSYLPLEDLKSSRLASRLFTNGAPRYMVNRVYATSRTSSLIRLTEIASNAVFSPAITIFRFGYVRLPDEIPMIQEYREFLNHRKEDEEGVRLPIDPSTDFSVDEYLSSYATYADRWRDHTEVIRSGLDLRLITKALQLLPNLRRIEIGPEPWYYDGQAKAMFHYWDLKRMCRGKSRLVFNHAEHIFKTMAAAVQSSQRRPKVFSFMPAAFPGDFETEGLWLSESARAVLSEVYDIDLWTPSAADPIHVRQTISSLPLRKLSLTSDSYNLHKLLATPIWPQLTELNLSLPLEQKTFVAFMKNHGQLSILTIRKSKLREGEWSTLLYLIKEHMNLDRVLLEHLSGRRGVYVVWKGPHCRYRLKPAEQYLLSPDEPNPFTNGAINIFRSRYARVRAMST